MTQPSPAALTLIAAAALTLIAVAALTRRSPRSRRRRLITGSAVPAVSDQAQDESRAAITDETGNALS